MRKWAVPALIAAILLLLWFAGDDDTPERVSHKTHNVEVETP